MALVVSQFSLNSTMILVFQEKQLKMSIGVPIKVLHEAEGHIVTCETNTGEVYRGKLIEAEDNMNCQVGFLLDVFSALLLLPLSSGMDKMQ